MFNFSLQVDQVGFNRCQGIDRPPATSASGAQSPVSDTQALFHGTPWEAVHVSDITVTYSYYSLDNVSRCLRKS